MIFKEKAENSDTDDVLERSREKVTDLLEKWKDPDRRVREEEASTDEEKKEEDERARRAESLSAPMRILATDDELADIPPEQREVVAREIASFRERANKRERDRIRKEEDYERQRLERLQAEKKNMSSETIAAPNLSKRAAPTSTYYQDPIKFSKEEKDNRQQEDSGADKDDASDELLEERRREQREDDLEHQFIERERKWLYREKHRIADIERDIRKDKEEEEERRRKREKASSTF